MVKDYKDYLGQLQKMYPDLSEETIETAVRKGLSGLQDLIRRDHDVRLENTNGNFDKYRMIFYRSMPDRESKMNRYFKNLNRLKKLREEKSKKYAERL